MLVVSEGNMLRTLGFIEANLGRVKFLEVVEEKSPYDVVPQGIIRIVMNGSVTKDIVNWPVKRGTWIEDDFGIHCSECWHHVEEETEYCPCCGTRMEAPEKTISAEFAKLMTEGEMKVRCN